MIPQTIYDQMIIDDYENVQDFKRRDGITKRYTGWGDYKTGGH